MTSNGKYASNTKCRGLNELSIATKNTKFGLVMKKLQPFKVDLKNLPEN